MIEVSLADIGTWILVTGYELQSRRNTSTTISDVIVLLLKIAVY